MELMAFIQEFFGELANLIPLMLIIPAGCLLVVLLLRRTAIRSSFVLASFSALIVTVFLFLTFVFGSVHSEMVADVVAEPLFWVGVLVTTLLATCPLWLFARFYLTRVRGKRAA